MNRQKTPSSQSGALEELLERNKLVELFDVQVDKRHGTIDGVEFDLRYAQLSLAEWQPEVFPTPRLLGGRLEDGPFIWFPWFGQFSSETLERDAEKMFSSKSRLRSRAGKAEIAKREFDEYIRFNTPECTVGVGDKICIDGVEIGHDAELRYARLRVERANGSSEILPTRLKFRTSDNILEMELEDISYVISQRILAYFKTFKLDDSSSSLNDGSYAYRALLAARRFEAKLKPKINIFADLRSSSPKFRRVVADLVNDAAFMGYLWGKAETELNMKPLAISALERRAKESIGGVKGGATRRKKAEETWIPIARAMAKQIREKQPKASQDVVAADIITVWKEREFDPPGHPRLKKLVADMEKSGEVPRRQQR